MGPGRGRSGQPIISSNDGGTRSINLDIAGPSLEDIYEVTLAAYRRKGVPPEALRLLSELVGVSKTGAKTEESKLRFAIREVLIH